MNDTNDRDTHRVYVWYPCERCGVTVLPSDFRDLPSAKEYHIVRLCQRCQDALYLAEPQHHPGPRLPLHEGVAAVAALEAGRLAELALLPFRFVAAEARIAWEPRFLLRAGPDLAPLDRFRELTPMRGPWSQHLLRVDEHRRLDAPALRARLSGAALVVGLDRAALDAVRTHCRAPSPAALAPLADQVPWRSMFGHPLQPFAAFVRHFALDFEDPCHAAAPSVLRTAALLAATLELPALAGPAPARTAFDHLLDAHRARLAASPPPRGGRWSDREPSAPRTRTTGP